MKRSFIMKLLVSLSTSYYEVKLSRAGHQVMVYVPHGPEGDQTKYLSELRRAVNEQNQSHSEANRHTWVWTDGRALVKRVVRDATHLTYDEFRGAYF